MQLHDYGEVSFDYEEYAIGGKMITVKVSVPDETFTRAMSNDTAREEVRQMLVEQIASIILDRKLCEITQMKDVMLTTTVAARCYVAPNEQIKILRTVAAK